MNRTIRNLSYDNLLFVDIETVRGLEEFDENNPFYDLWAWKQRDKDTNEIPETAEVIKSYYDKAALHPEWGKIVCISVGYIHQDELYVTSYKGEEGEILLKFVELVKKQSRKLVFHNGINFDLPYIRKRWFINELGEYISEKQGNDVYTKPWDLDEAVFDTMRAWKGSGYHNTGMDELAMSFGIPSSKDEMKGNEVSRYYYEGRIDDIVAYCERDVEVLVNIVRRWKGDSIVKANSIKQVEVKETPLLERIYNSKELTDEDKEQIRKMLLVKKPSETDKEIILDILHKSYIDSSFDKKDSKKVVEEKLNELKQIIE